MVDQRKTKKTKITRKSESESRATLGFDKFHALESEKQQRIVKAALLEFGKEGYERASTNAIAEKAQIGKGMLFYYFGSKRELFNFLCEYSLAFTKEEYLRGGKLDTPDFLERYVRVTEMKKNAIENHSEVIIFFESYIREESSPYFAKFQSEIEEIRQQVFVDIYKKIDYSLFREDIDGKAAVKYLQWLIDGYVEEVKKKYRGGGGIPIAHERAIAAEWRRFYDFVDDLRRLYYKDNIDVGATRGRPRKGRSRGGLSRRTSRR
jgi:AcrR family transcriptional regulator